STGIVGTQGVDHDDVQIGPEKWEVVVAAIPDDEIRAGGRLLRDARVVDTREHDVAGRQVRLVLFALFDGAAGGVQILELLEALRALALEIGVRHGMADDGDAATARPQAGAEPASDRRL